MDSRMLRGQVGFNFFPTFFRKLTPESQIALHRADDLDKHPLAPAPSNSP
jgi:hypothetical protein